MRGLTDKRYDLDVAGAGRDMALSRGGGVVVCGCRTVDHIQLPFAKKH